MTYSWKLQRGIISYLGKVVYLSIKHAKALKVIIE